MPDITHPEVPHLNNLEISRCKTDLDRLISKLDKTDQIPDAVVALLAMLLLRVHESSPEAQRLARRLGSGTVGQLTADQHDIIAHAFANDQFLKLLAERYAEKLRRG